MHVHTCTHTNYCFLAVWGCLWGLFVVCVWKWNTLTTPHTPRFAVLGSDGHADAHVTSNAETTTSHHRLCVFFPLWLETFLPSAATQPLQRRAIPRVSTEHTSGPAPPTQRGRRMTSSSLTIVIATVTKDLFWGEMSILWFWHCVFIKQMAKRKRPTRSFMVSQRARFTHLEVAMAHRYDHRQGHDPPSLFANLCRLREPADRGSGLCRGALHSGHPPHPQWVHMSVLVCYFAHPHLWSSPPTVTVMSTLWCFKVGAAAAISSRSPGSSVSLHKYSRFHFNVSHKWF